MKQTKNRKNITASGYDKQRVHDPADAVTLVRTLSFAKFDESIDVAFELGIVSLRAPFL